ncbi:MAG: hypothetical protein ACJ749_02555 [Flavisolibacter sp.]
MTDVRTQKEKLDKLLEKIDRAMGVTKSGRKKVVIDFEAFYDREIKWMEDDKR